LTAGASAGATSSRAAERNARADGNTGTGRRGKSQRRPPRLASLQLKRIDPWTVLKISLIVAIVMFFVWMIAVGVLYLSLGSMDVWTKVNSTWQALTSADASGSPQPLITPGAVFGVTAVIGAINIVLFTALATIAAFVYNAAAGMSGGVEITLGERD
jgi:pheromone shutdown protein TraB